MGRKLDNWIEAYREYTEGTESPATFHLWVAIGTLAAAAQRKVWLDMGHYQVHSNLYIILVAPPGMSRKSTALRIGKNLLIGVKDYGQEVNFSTQASSVAAMVKQFTAITNREHQSLTAFSSEIGSLLGSKSVEMTDFLTDIYDCDPGWDKQTVGRGLEKIEHPWLNLLGATTPQWMGDNLSKTAIEGGFVSRSIFVFDNTRLLVAFPELTERQRELKKLLTNDLAHICTIKGEFRFTSKARSYYKEWYEDKARMDAVSRDYRISGYYERKHIHAKKVAMALSLARKDERMIELEEIKAAIIILEAIEPGMKTAFAAVGKNTNATTTERIKQQVFMAGKIPYKRLLAANVHDVPRKDFDEILQALMAMGEIDWKHPWVMRVGYMEGDSNAAD